MERVEARNSKLRSLRIDDVGHLILVMQMEAFKCLRHLFITCNHKVEKLSEVEEMFRSCLSSLRRLRIGWCSKLKSVSGGLEHLTALEELTLYRLPDLRLSKEGEGEEDSDDNGMPWRSFQHSLRSLELEELPKLVKLPNGMRHLTSLQSLTITGCTNLESIPEWMPQLTSLNQLHIERCSFSLYRRCRKDTGKDWPSIHHIPHLDIKLYSSDSSYSRILRHSVL